MTREELAAMLLRIANPPVRVNNFMGIPVYVDPLMPDGEMRVVQDGKIVSRATFLPKEVRDGEAD